MIQKKIRIPKESANEILFALGKLKNAIEFEDLTKNDIEAKKSFGDMIKRCDEMKKKIDEFLQICREFQIPLSTTTSFNNLNSRLSLDICLLTFTLFKVFKSYKDSFVPIIYLKIK